MNLKLNAMDRAGKEQPVQMWTSVWDSRYVKSNYIKFEELIVKPLYQMYGVPCEGSISTEVKRFIRPVVFYERGMVNHKWGDLFVHKDFTCFKIYGFKGTPYLLPKLVPDRISYLEIVRQLSVSNAKNFGGMHKQTFLLVTLSFGDFTIVSTKAYEAIDRKLIEEYNLFKYATRVNYDPGGYIHNCNKSQNLGDYIHVYLEAEDMFRNMEEEEAQMAIDELNKKLDEKKKRLQEMETEEEESEGESE